MTDQPRPFRFIHCADLYLDSPFEGLLKVDDQIGPALRDATFRAFENVIDLAVREHVDLILIAGDVFDGARRSLKAQLRFRDALARATAAGIPFCIAHGDRDPLCDWQIDLPIPPGSYRFEGDTVERITIPRDGQPLVDVHGLSCATRDGMGNPTPRFRRDGPSPLAIGLLHCAVDEPAGHGHLAACSLDDLADTGMDYWALGHVHEHRILRESAPTVAYAGYVQGRNLREAGPHGCLLVHVDDTGHFHPQFVATDTVRWFERSVDVAPFEDLDGLRNTLNDMREQVRYEAEGRAAVVRLHLNGNGRLHSLLQRGAIVGDLADQLREGEAQRQDFVWVESLRSATRPAMDIGQRREIEDFVGDYLRTTHTLRETGDAAQAVRQVLSEHPDHKEIRAEIDALVDDELLSILDDAEVIGWDLVSSNEDG
jgi:exonuclease SbcD